MRKLLLISAVCAMTTTASWAQSSKYDTAKDAVTGDNTATVEGEKSDSILWKYSADKDYIATVGPLTGKYDYVYVSTIRKNADTQKNDTITMKGVNAGTGRYYYPFAKGNTYYMTILSYGETGFNLALEESEDISGGLSEDKPVQISLSGITYLGNPMSTGYATYKAYASYTATEDGQLILKSQNYTSVEVNGVSYSPSYDNATSQYLLKIGVETGKTYICTFSIYSPVAFTAEIAHPEKGSADMPFDLVEGENTVPADNKTYYYTYTPTKAGYLNITSEASLPGGSVKIYDSIYGIQYGNPKAQSETGSFNVRMEIPSPTYGGFPTYYILVDKVDKTETEDKFNVELENYKAGETEDSPISIDRLPAEVTLPTAQGTYYYSVAVPANTNKFLNVKTELNNVNDGTEIAIYPQGQSIYSGVRGYDNLDLDVTSTEDASYIIKVTSAESKPISFTATYKDIQKGDLITNPADAVLGDNTISGDGTKYYTYTATRSGKLQVSGTPDMTVEFPMGTGTYDGTYEAKQSGVNFFITAEAGKAYLIKISNAKDGDVFTLSEEDYKVGEDRTNPLEAENGEVTITNDNATNLWISYTAKTDGVLTVYCDAPYNWTNTVEFGKATDDYLSAMITTAPDPEDKGGTISIYKATVSVKKGDKYLMYISLANATEQYKATFTERDYEAGETVETALVLEEGKTVSVNAASNTHPIWVKARLGVGTAQLQSSDYLNGSMFSSLEDAQNLTNARSFYFQQDYSSSDNICNYNPEIETEADYFFRFTSSYEGTTVTLVKSNASATAISTVGESQYGFSVLNGQIVAKGKVDVYSVNGSKVASLSDGGNTTLKAGVYVINCNGKAKKVVVK